MIVGLRSRPNYSDIISTIHATPVIQIELTESAILNKGIMLKNLQMAKEEINSKENNIIYDSLFFDADEIPSRYIKDALIIAKTLGIKFRYYESLSEGYEKYMVKIKKIKELCEKNDIDVVFQNPQGYGLNKLVSDFFSNQITISLNLFDFIKSTIKYDEAIEAKFINYKDDIEILFKDNKDKIDDIIIDFSEINTITSKEFNDILAILARNRFSNHVILNVENMTQKETSNSPEVLKIIETVRNNFKEKKIKKGLVMFDADNTLYDIFPEVAYKKLYDLLSRMKNKPPEEIKERHRNLINEVKKSKDPKKRTLLYTLSKLLNDKDMVEEAYELFWHNICNELKPRKHLKEVIRELSYDYELIVFSDEFKPILINKLNSVFPEWKEYFKEIVTPEITDSMKPSRKYYDYVLKKYKYKKENIWVVGDSWKRDLELAKKLGLNTILLKEFKPKTIFDSFDDIRKDIDFPDYEADDFRNIINIIKKKEG